MIVSRAESSRLSLSSLNNHEHRSLETRMNQVSLKRQNEPGHHIIYCLSYVAFLVLIFC